VNDLILAMGVIGAALPLLAMAVYDATRRTLDSDR